MAKIAGNLAFAGEDYTYDLWEPGNPIMICEDSVCGIDTETELIQNHYTSPPLVLFGACSGRHVQMCGWEYFEQYQKEFLKVNPKTKFAFFNGPFDQRVMGSDTWIPELNKDNRVMELQAAYPAHKIATKGWFNPHFTLESLTLEFLKVQLDKDESVRLAFKREEKPTDKQYVYMAYDAISTYKLGKLLENQPTESIQARAAYVLADISMNGMLVDQEYVEQQQNMWKAVLVEESARLRSFGYPLKRSWDDFTAREFVEKICENVGVDNVGVILGDKDRFSQLWWKSMALVLYGRVLNKDPISAIRADVRQLLVDATQPVKQNKAYRLYKERVDQILLGLMEEIDCTECLTGLNIHAPAPRGSAAWKILAYITSERIANGTPQSNYLRDEVHKEIQEEFRELHDQNRGWLTEFKPLSANKFLQNHVKQLKQQYPELDLTLTKASKKAVNARLVEEAKAAKREKREQQQIDVSDLTIYQVTGKEAWRFTDQGIDDPFLKSYWRFKHAEKMLGTYVTLKYVEGDGRVHTRFTNFLKTGRTGSSSPNIQNLPGEAGLREMYVPAVGRVLVSIDFSQEELCALGQHCKLFFGHSRMYDLINHDLDLHGMFAAYRDGKLKGYDLANLSEDDVKVLKELLKFYKEDDKGKKARKLAKVANFGLGGGMQAKTFYVNIRNAGFDMTMEEVQKLIDDWYTFYPEIKEFHNLQVDGYVPASTFDKSNTEGSNNDLSDEQDDDEDDEDIFDELDTDPVQEVLRDASGNALEDPERMVRLYRTVNALGMVKARGTKCAVANYNFQSYAAVANKVAMWWVFYSEWERSKRLNVEPRFKIICFIHDELIFEVAKEYLAEVVDTNSKLMVGGVKSMMPGVLIKTEATVMTRWTKDEKSEYIIKTA